jgi:hypothetical protein
MSALAKALKSILATCEAVRMNTDGTYSFTRGQRDFLIARAQGMEFAATRIRNLERELERIEAVTEPQRSRSHTGR